MRLDIIGSRTCPPVDIMLYLKHLPTAIISGGDRGADTYARDFKVLIDFNIIFSVITKIIVIFAFNLNS